MSENEEESVTPETRGKLLAELKKKLKEIEELKATLQSQKGESKPEKLPLYQSTFDPGKVREAVEEITVPPLELLDDKPIVKKQKKEQESQSA